MKQISELVEGEHLGRHGMRKDWLIQALKSTQFSGNITLMLRTSPLRCRAEHLVYSVLWQRPCKDVQGWTSPLFQGEMVESF